MGTINWKGEAVLLEEAKQNRISDLGVECNLAITGKFYAEVEGVTYMFSCDSEAQKNFDKGLKVFENGWKDQLPWTAYDMDGNVIRLTLNPTNFPPVYMAHLDHIQYHISKFRDILQPKVELATTPDEVALITYNGGL